MGTKRVGLARIEALIENLKRELKLGADAKIVGGAYHTAVADVQHNNTTDAAAVGSATISAGVLSAGDCIYVKARGRCISTNSTDTLTPTLKIGSTTIQAGAALNVDNNDIVDVEAFIQIRTVGSSGTFVAIGEISSDALGATKLPFTKTSTVIDTTAALTVTLEMDWSVANASNQYTQDFYMVKID